MITEDDLKIIFDGNDEVIKERDEIINELKRYIFELNIKIDSIPPMCEECGFLHKEGRMCLQ